MFKQVRQFLALFDAHTHRMVLVASLLMVALAAFDFASLVILFPVFATLSGGNPATAMPLDLFGGLDAGGLLIIAMGLMMGRSMLGFAIRLWWGYRAAESEVALSSKLLQTYAFAPYSFHLRSNSSELLGRAVSHVNMATNTGLNGLVLLSGDLASCGGMVLALFVVNPMAAASITLYLGLMAGFFQLFSRRYIKRQSEQLTRNISLVYAKASSVLRGIRELTVANGREVALEEMAAHRRRMARTQRNLLVISDVPRVVLEVGLYTAILIALLAVLGRGDSTTLLPVVALYVVAGLRILPALARMLGTLTQVRTGFEIGRQLAEEMQEITSSGNQVHRSAGELPDRGSLRMKAVSFAYDGESQVLRDVDLDVPFGSSIGIIGPSGSGKTTLLGVLLGLLPATDGCVRFGGADIGVADADWMSRVAYVPQDVYVADDTLFANVCLGEDEEARDTQGALIALERAQLGSLLSRDFGLDSPLREGGTRLSVGQRQRLGIARALYRDARILLLDEPTAALDSNTETQVVQTFKALQGTVTTIVVAHRLATLQDMDAIYSLDGGRLERVR